MLRVVWFNFLWAASTACITAVKWMCLSIALYRVRYPYRILALFFATLAWVGALEVCQYGFEIMSEIPSMHASEPGQSPSNSRPAYNSQRYSLYGISIPAWRYCAKSDMTGRPFTPSDKELHPWVSPMRGQERGKYR